MENWILTHEPLLRMSVFFGLLIVLAGLEWRWPRRALQWSKLQRWRSNLSLVIFNSLILRLVFPLAAVGVASFAQAQGWGLLPWLAWPLYVQVLIALLFMDFAIYIQHVLFHALPLLWRLHRVHHADGDYDVTTGARFHPIEIILSMLIKCALIVLLGPPIIALVLFEILLNATAMFNHSNLYLPKSVDSLVRLCLVTPDMHRIHHSTDEAESNRNFGFNLPWWDRLFGTYQAQPSKGHQDMTIGVAGLNPQRYTQFRQILLLPWQNKTD